MEETCVLRPIAHVHSEFPGKFGIPRQSGVVPELRSELIFAPEFRNPDALRGIEGFDRLWLIWEFSANRRASWSPTVRPPRLGGNTRLGVFATRSPFRPNPLGMSCVVLTGVRQDAKLGPVLCLSGADLMDGTPVFDIKPYLPYSDCFPDARAGFTALAPDLLLGVDFPPELLERIPEAHRSALLGVLSHDPRPSYQDDPARRYGMAFAGFDIHFTVSGGRLTVVDVVPMGPSEKGSANQ